MGYLVDPKLWDDSRFIRLSDGARVVYLLLLTGPTRSSLPGLVRNAGPGALAEALARSPADIVRALDELVDVELVQFDRDARLARVPDAPQHWRCPNANVLISWYKIWMALPISPLKFAHVASLRDAVNFGTQSVAIAWDQTFAVIEAAIDKGRENTLTLTDLEARLPKRGRAPFGGGESAD